MLEKIEETKRFLAPLTGDREISAGIILGSGAGTLADDLVAPRAIPYASIPHFPRSTVQGHAGRLLVGELEGKRVIMMQGRFHFYEGYSMQEVTFPVRVARALGARALLVTNAAGGLNPDYRPGDLMVIEDHLNLFPEHPLRGNHREALGPRFPSMDAPYSPRLVSLALEAAARPGVEPRRGIYVGVQGPSFETPAECRWLRLMGGDAVGMSTVPEVIVARHAGMECLGISVIANRAGSPASHEEVLETMHLAAPRLSLLVRHLLRHA
jgi:purine-nucleoside phosphorylase